MMTMPLRATRLGFAPVFFLLLIASTASARQSSQPATSTTPQAQQSPNSNSGQAASGQNQQPGTTAPAPGQTAEGGSKDRLFYTLPNFLTLENAANVPPLTVGQKFKLITRSSFDPAQFAWYGVISAVGQANNSESAYGQGWGAYGKRYATDMADGVIEGYMVSGVFPSLLRQDPRYFVLGKGGFWHRTEYALSRLIITRSDSGHSVFNASEIFGSAAGAAISTYGYHPQNEKNLSNAATVWGTQVGYDAIAIVVKEFWPDVRRKIHKKRNGDQN
jgi:hypothetical protein